jgi:hypothetical protein
MTEISSSILRTTGYPISAAVPTLNELNFTSGGDAGNPFIGNVKCVAVFKEALTDTELEDLTTI